MLAFQLMALIGGWGLLANLGGTWTPSSARNAALSAASFIFGVAISTWLALR